MAVLKEVRCQWASVLEPNTKFEHRWEIDAILSDAQAAALLDQGVTVKEDEGIKTHRFKRKCSGTKKDGGTYSLDPPKVVDAHKVPFTKLIGNGSLVNIQYTVRSGEMMGNAYTKADLVAVQVLELVEYGGGGNSDEFADEGDTKVIKGESTEEEGNDEDIF